MQKRVPGGGPMPRTLYDLLNTLFFTLQKKPLLSDFTYLGLKQARPKNLPKKVKNFWNGVPEGSHSRPPGRSKSMAFERIFAGRKAPPDVWPGPPRCSLCLVVTQEVSDVHRSLCKILMVVVEYHHHHHHHSSYLLLL